MERDSMTNRRTKPKNNNSVSPQLIQIAAWYNALRERNNDAFFPLFFNTSRFLVLKGGGGSGKSIFAGQKVLERCTSEAGHRWLVCRKVARTLRESCFEQLCGQIGEYYPDSGAKINKSDMSITFANGSKILFAGLDDVEKLKSIYNITGIWIEEASELKESDFNQLNIRLRGKTKYYKQIILTFNPISIKHWLKKRFWDYRDPRATVHESTYKDNKFMRREDILTLESFKETDEYYYMVYALGMWGVTGKSVFDSRAITARLQEDLKPSSRGMFVFDYDGLRISGIRFSESDDGFIKICKAPERGVPYVIGADTAGDGSDSFVAQVLDNRTGEQVATLRHRTDEDLFAKQLFCLGMYYNTALIGVETNWSTYPVMELERLRYPKQYVRETFDSYTHKVKTSFGFNTNTKTRPVIISELITAVRDDIGIVNDEDTLEEMLTFVRDESFRPEAEEGAHDDCVMALAIAHHIRPGQSCLKEKDPDATVEWSESMWEDYRSATAEEREMLVKLWGKPR